MATEKLDLLILKTLALEPRHGYGIGQRIEQVSRGVFRVTLGALYPALERLERAGAISSKWALSENNRRARYYALTAAGRRRLTTERQAWERSTEAMTRVLQADAE
ncbi:MAG: PadR family transcriptional regulator [bacterium]